MRRIQRVDHIRFLIPDLATRNRLALGLVDQPILVLLVDPRPARHLEGCGPYAEGQAISDDAVCDEPHAIRELCGIGCGVLSTGVLIALINLEILVAE